MDPDHERLIAGAMTGTSIDGIDVALVRLRGRGLATTARLVRHRSAGLGALAGRLRAAAEQTPLSAGAFAALARDLGDAHAEAIADLLEPGETPDLVAVHGQTVYHRPPRSWQMIDPAPIATRLGCPVAFDLRGGDLAAGGEGAPITPLADWVLFRDPRRRRAVVNLGGFCNVTVLPADDGGDGSGVDAIRGFDWCPCNHVLDAVARVALDAPYDAGGAAARRGRVDDEAAADLAALLGAGAAGRAGTRSLGTGDEAAAWVDAHATGLAGADLAATAVAAVAGRIGAALSSAGTDETIVAGGGARNDALVDAITRSAQQRVRRSDELGVPVAAREAAAMAVLGGLAADGVPITLPAVTGRDPAADPAVSWCRAGAP
ncbi:MAG: anhydro-N-acetylmuramic acid kinase [Planctomycetota bacterium]|jgi:1,6-anhydro-N-acetylmuramate kinase